MTHIRGHKYKDTHLLIQGDFILAVNEACVILGDILSRKVEVAFSEHKWIAKDKDLAKLHGDDLIERLKNFYNGSLSEEVLFSIASVCMDHYIAGEKQGWIKRVLPTFVHDCDDCIFMGIIANDEENFLLDLYYCPENKPYPTVIARYGSALHESKGGILFGMFGLDDDLQEAYIRASGMGLVNGVKLPRINALDTGRSGTTMSANLQAALEYSRKSDSDKELGMSFLVRDDDGSA